MTLPQVILFGMAVASLRHLLVLDRITQWIRYKLVRAFHKAGGFIPKHLDYMYGCASCLPLWLAIILYALRNTNAGQIATVLLAMRFVAWFFLRYLQETNRDWPPELADKWGKIE